MSYGILGGLGAGMSKVADNMNDTAMLQFKLQAQQDMEQRIYERNRTDKSADEQRIYERDRADKSADRIERIKDAKDLARFKAGIDKNDPAKQLEIEKLQDEKLLRRNANRTPEEIDSDIGSLTEQVSALIKNNGNPNAIKEVQAKLDEQKRIKALVEAGLATRSTTTTEVDPITGEQKDKTVITGKIPYGRQPGKYVASPEISQKVMDIVNGT